MKYIWLIDSGHGGMTVTGGYTTAPAKMYEHSPNEVFYEGQFNRQIKSLLTRMLWEQAIDYVDICPTELDIPLSVRVDSVNAYAKHYENCVLISLHSNAAENPGEGSGFEIWTSYGPTRADKFAELLGQELMSAFADIPFRADKADNDLDKESDFYILKWTACPAIMSECLFYDNYNNYLLLTNPDFRVAYAKILVNFMRKAEEQNI
jgi:N-acetylmuramoyl-L-alanine amidase